jgi:5-(carboxyamino)imidazole ribonucleotide mutase
LSEPAPLPQVHPVWEELGSDGPQVGIVMASESDREIMNDAVNELLELAITFELRVLSAHRDPREVAEYASTAALRGLRVIGVPIRREELGGMDSLLSIVQMPPGVPVACMAVNGARNAAIYASKILSQGHGPPPPEL